MADNDRKMSASVPTRGEVVADEKMEELKDCIMDDEEPEPMKAPTMDLGAIDKKKSMQQQPKEVELESSSISALSTTSLRRQPLQHAPDQPPGAFRISGLGDDVSRDDDEIATHTVVDEGELESPPALQSTQSELLVNAELVVEGTGAGRARDSDDFEPGNHPDDSNGILTAAPMEDKQIISHLMKQRRVQIYVGVTAVIILGLVVGMSIGFTSGRQDSLIVIENGTQTIITDDEIIDTLTDPGDAKIGNPFNLPML